MIVVIAVEDYGETGFLGLGYSGNDTPRLGWFARDGEFVHSAGSGYLKKELDKGTISADSLILKLSAYLEDPQNDALRARGDVRWRTVSRAHGMCLTKIS